MPQTPKTQAVNPKKDLKRIVLVGGGFAGIQMLKNLPDDLYEVILFDRHNYHTFQPLLYQVATAGLEPDSIAGPLRKVFENRKNFHFRMALVEKLMPEQNKIMTTIGEVEYDILVMANGTRTNYFGNDALEDRAFPLKQVPQALNLRSQILQCFEKAVIMTEKEDRERLMSFVIVGAGPTGVELAGALGELKKHVLHKDYPDLDINLMKIYLVEGLKRVLPPMSEEASAKAEYYLKNFGVDVRLETMVESYDGQTVTFNDGSKLPTETMIWAAGVTGAAIEGLREGTLARGNRVKVDRFCRVEGYENIYAIGDLATMKTEKFENGHPQLAAVAMQQGKLLGKNLRGMHQGKEMEKFEYLDKGSMATIGRNRAVADLPGFKTQGLFAWFIWMFVHLLFIVEFRSKMVIFINWVWNYFTFDRGTRLIIRPVRQRRAKTPKSEMKGVVVK